MEKGKLYTIKKKADAKNLMWGSNTKRDRRVMITRNKQQRNRLQNMETKNIYFKPRI